MQAVNNEERFFYLFACFSGTPDESPQTVFYVTRGESIAKSLCGLFVREYADDEHTFSLRDAESISAAEHVLLDEMIDLLAIYDEPDPGIYDPEPSADVHLRAQYAVRATKWEELLRRRTLARDQGSDADNSESGRQETTMDELPEVSPEEERNAIMVLLMLLAQAYYQTLECTISMASILTELDLELNQSYLWTVQTITNLLKNSEHLRDFPVPFEPLFGDLYPSTISDLDWRDGVAPDAERFLSTVQRYVLAKGIYEPQKGSIGWCFIELYRPSVNIAIERAVAYDKRVRKTYQRYRASTSKTTEPSRDAQTIKGAASHGLPMNRKTVFISYRRDATGRPFARSLERELTRDGYDVFLDVDSIGSGKWANQILTEVPCRAHFLLLLTPAALDSCANEDDWVRQEFETAVKHSRNIVPVCEESIDLGKLRKECPVSMKQLFDYQIATIHHSAFESDLRTLINRYIPPHKAPQD